MAEALAIARGEIELGRIHVTAELDVRTIRNKTEMSQDSFASAFGFTVSQIRQWEQGRHWPTEAMRAYLMLIDRDPEAVLASLLEMNQDSLKVA